jgi:predicted dehydrogenase
MKKKRKLRGALIGAGDVSRFHLEAWARIPDADIVAIADPSLERAFKRACDFGIPSTSVHADTKELLNEQENLAFVDITAGPDVQSPLIAYAAGHGLHILCQKPPAESLSEAKQSIEICDQNGVLLCVNENWRWRPWYRELKRVLSEGVIGIVVYANFFAHGPGWLPGEKRDPSHRFYRWPRAILFDYGIHLIDIIRFLFGEPEKVYAQIGSINTTIKGEERAVAMYKYPELTSLLDISWSSYATWGQAKRRGPLVEAVRIEGDKGTVELIPMQGEPDRIRITTQEGVSDSPAYEGDPFDNYIGSYVGAQEHFIASISENKIPETAAHNYYRTLAAMLAAYRSAELDQVVAIDEFISWQEN